MFGGRWRTKSGFRKSDWFLGLARALLVLFASGSDLLQSSERKVCDMREVYVGRDPEIGRAAAIKAMALRHEFELDESAEVEERFFLEPETAGRLSHPRKVTIYDAGEEHDLCYIAIELLKRGDRGPVSASAHSLIDVER